MNLDMPAAKNLVLPDRPSGWLFSACIFMAPLAEIKATSQIAVADLLIVFTIISAIAERLIYREMQFSKIQIQVILFAGLAGFLVLCSYYINILQFNNYQQPQISLHAFSHMALPGRSSLLFGAKEQPHYQFWLFSLFVILVPTGLLLTKINSSGQFRFFLIIWSLGALYGCIHALAGVSGLINVGYDWYWDALGRLTGLTSHPNVFAMNCVLALPGMAALFICSERIWVRLLALSGGILILFCVSLSGSRGALVGLFLYPLLFIIFKTTDLRQLLRVGLVTLISAVTAVAALIVSLPYLQLRGSSALVRLVSGSRGSDNVRETINGLAWQDALESPIFGNGYEYLRIAHNIYLQHFHAGGIVGLAGYLVMLCLPIVLIFSSRARHMETGISANFLALISMLVILGLVKSNLSDINISIAFGLAMAWGVFLHHRRASNPSPTGYY